MPSKFLLVAQREYLSRVTKRAFIVLTLLVPVLIAGFFGVVGKIALSDSSTDMVDVRDESGLDIGRRLAAASTPKLQFVPAAGSLADAKKSFQKQKHAGLLYLPAGLDRTDPKGIQFFGKGTISLEKQARVERALTDAFGELKMQQAGLTQAQLDQLRAHVDLDAVSVDEKGQEKASNSGATTIVAGALAVMIYFFIFLYGVQIMRGVGEEKSSRVMEVMLSSVKPFDLMMGKILGIAAVGLTQFLLWGLLSWGASAVIAPLLLSGDDAAKTEMAATTKKPATATSAASATEAAPEMAAQMQPGSRLNMMSQVMEQADKLNISIWTVAFGFIAYFLGGYLIYGALFGAVGAAVDDQTDTQQFMFPITMPLILSYILGFSVILRNPDGPVAFWMSMIPLTSPVAMVIRLPFGVPGWQLALSLGLLVLGFVGTVWVAARIYRVGVLMYGKKVSYKELSKWLFYKG